VVVIRGHLDGACGLFDDTHEHPSYHSLPCTASFENPWPVLEEEPTKFIWRRVTERQPPVPSVGWIQESRRGAIGSLCPIINAQIFILWSCSMRREAERGTGCSDVFYPALSRYRA